MIFYKKERLLVKESLQKGLLCVKSLKSSCFLIFISEALEIHSSVLSWQDGGTEEIVLDPIVNTQAKKPKQPKTQSFEFPGGACTPSLF